MYELLYPLIDILNDPVVRATTTAFAFISFAVSIFAYKRTSEVLTAHHANMRAEQERFLQSQWGRVNRMVIADVQAAEIVAEMLGNTDAGDAKKELVYLSFLNVLFAAFVAQKNQALDRAVYEGHMDYYFENFEGDPVYLMRVVRRAHCHPDFISDCEARLKKRLATASVTQPTPDPALAQPN